MFNKNLYYSYIKILETITILVFITYCLVSGMAGAIIYEIKGLLIGLLISFISGYPIYLILKIKVEEMKWKLDIYNKINEK